MFSPFLSVGHSSQPTLYNWQGATVVGRGSIETKGITITQWFSGLVWAGLGWSGLSWAGQTSD